MTIHWKRFGWARVLVGCCLLFAAALGRDRGRAHAVGRLAPGLEWGIEPVSIRTSAGGYLLDFRYRVVDAIKAEALFKPDVKPVLLDAATGKSMAMSQDAKLGALRASSRSTPVNGKEYYVLFNNSAGLQKGSAATVALGKCTLPGLVVQ